MPHAANTPITATGTASTSTTPKGFMAAHKGRHKKKSSMLTSKKKANSGADSMRISLGNDPNVPRLASQRAAVTPAIANQL
jgi:hypothetical protein